MLDNGWEALNSEFEKTYMAQLREFLQLSGPFLPHSSLVFNAFKKCSYEATRVVIVGMDPYFYPAASPDGLAFSAASFTPSLQKIKHMVELEGFTMNSPRLDSWAEQGILLLNSTLTVGVGNPGSHQNKGWEKFISVVLDYLVWTKQERVIFCAWGAMAKSLVASIAHPNHIVLTAEHPANAARENRPWRCDHISKLVSYSKEIDSPLWKQPLILDT